MQTPPHEDGISTKADAGTFEKASPAPSKKRSHLIQIVSMVNYLKTCLQPYLVRSCCSDTVEVAELVDIMASGRTTLTKPDITGCLQLFVEELIKLVADGKHVKNPVGSFYIAASGRLETKNQPPRRRHPRPRTDPTLSLEQRDIEAKTKSQARWERVETFDTSGAAVDDYSVFARGAGENAPGGATQSALPAEDSNSPPRIPPCGVFLENDARSWRCPVYADIAPSKLIATLHAEAPAGTYNLVVTTMPNGKDLKNGYYDKAFIVA